jgi:tetratricopeptide (TPR) repeat protein
VQPVGEWTAAVEESIVLADKSGDDDLRMAIRTPGAYSYLCAGDFSRCEQLIDEALEIAGDDHGAGTGIVIACPYAWCLMVKAVIRREEREFDESEELSELAIRIADEQGDPETESWTRGNLAIVLAYRGDLDGALRVAQRNYELTERLGDVFSRHWALLYLGFVHLERDEAESGLGYLERADTLYMEAMGTGGEAEGWRGAMIADGLLGVGRTAEALERAEQAAAVCRDRGLEWGLPYALQILARIRVAAGEPGAEDLLDEAEGVCSKNGQLRELDEVRTLRDTVAASSAS